MGFGEELWDKWDDVMKLSDDNIKQMSHLRDYLKEFSKIEKNFAADVKALVMKYQKPQKHSLDIYDQIYEATSLGKAWSFVLTKTLHIAAQHDDISREINDGPINQLKEVIKAQEKEKKGYHMAGQAKISLQKKQTALMHKARDEFHSCCKSAENQRQVAAQYETAPNKTPDKVKQLQIAVQKAEKKAAVAKAKYEEQIHALNKFNANHHTHDMPQIFQQAEVAMSSRIETMKQVVIDVADSLTSKQPTLLDSMEAIKGQGQVVSEAEDLLEVCSMMHTGPMNYEVNFEEWDPAGKGNRGKLKATWSINSSPHSSKADNRKNGSIDTTKGAVIDVHTRLQEIDADLRKLSIEIEAVEKLAESYREQPSYGDVRVPEGQLKDLNRSIQALEAERDELQRNSALSPGRSGRMSSDNSAVLNSPANPALPPGWVEAQDEDGVMYYYREDGGPSQYEHPGRNREEDDFSRPPSPPPSNESACTTQKAKALYAFTDEGEGLLQMSEGEQLDVIANAGDGWVHVKNSKGEEGYVPEDYIEMS